MPKSLALRHSEAYALLAEADVYVSASLWDGTSPALLEAEMFVALRKYGRVFAQASHGIGKTLGAAVGVNWHFDCFDPSITLTTAPSQRADRHRPRSVPERFVGDAVELGLEPPPVVVEGLVAALGEHRREPWRRRDQRLGPPLARHLRGPGGAAPGAVHEPERGGAAGRPARDGGLQQPLRDQVRVAAVRRRRVRVVADREAEGILRAHIAARHPGHAILGEEYGAAGSTARRWILDPIDGTKNYVRGVPVWATLIALLVDEVIVVGVVSAPALARRWWAARGMGAFAVDPATEEPRRLQVSAVSALADASFSYSDAIGWDARGAGRGLQTLLSETWRQRAYGDFWSHMMVAEGVVDVAAEPQLESYDMAALVPIVEEAGIPMLAAGAGTVARYSPAAARAGT